MPLLLSPSLPSLSSPVSPCVPLSPLFQAAQMEHARDIALTSLCEALVAGMSPDLRAATLKQLLPDILKNPCRGTGGKAGRLRL